MRIDRDTLRTVVPPVLALAAVALLVRPLAAAPVLESTYSSVQVGSASRAVEGTGAAGRVPRTADAATAPGTAAQSLSVVVPDVTFQAQAQRVGSRVRTAVLVNIAQPGGTASVDGTSCRTDARPGRAAWLNCPATGATSVSVTVRLSDGRVFRSSGIPVVG